jgi:5'-phosphate synthase pdxT subunit
MNYKDYNIGVLALQGDFERHLYQLDLLGARNGLVKLPRDLAELDGLIMPGGESTTMNILFDRFNLREPLTEFGRSKPIYGTCAGMIMLAKHIDDNLSKVETLGLIDIDVVRNAYGRQVFSFEDDVPVSLDNGTHTVRATFIRAPKVVRTGPGVEILATYRDSPVLVREKHILAGSFHTELDDDTTILRYFFSHFLADKQ